MLTVHQAHHLRFLPMLHSNLRLVFEKFCLTTTYYSDFVVVRMLQKLAPIFGVRHIFTDCTNCMVLVQLPKSPKLTIIIHNLMKLWDQFEDGPRTRKTTKKWGVIELNFALRSWVPKLGKNLTERKIVK